MFTEVATTTLGTAEPPWHGATARAAQQRAGQDRMRVIGVADELHDAARIAGTGAREISAARAEVLRAVAEAHAAGFIVTDEFSVTGTGGATARPGQADGFATRLRVTIGTLVGADDSVAAKITAATAGLGLPVFAESGGPDPLPSPADPHRTLAAVESANLGLLADLENEYRALPDGRVRTDRMADIAAIRAALQVPEAHLVFLARPDDPSQMIRAATSVGDPYTADHVSVTVPGVTSTTRQALAAMTRESHQLKAEATKITEAQRHSATIATIAYTGYQPPLTMDHPETLSDDVAQANAPDLTSFLRDLDGAGKPGHTLALFGHSYGSLMSGIALQGGAAQLVDNVVLYGSPGFQAHSASELGLRDEQFFVMTAPDDFVSHQIGGVAPLHGWGADPNTVVGRDYLFTHLETRAATVQLGDGQAWDLTAAQGHSEYAREATQRMTGFNLAAILLNQPDLAVKEQPSYSN